MLINPTLADLKTTKLIAQTIVSVTNKDSDTQSVVLTKPYDDMISPICIGFPPPRPNVPIMKARYHDYVPPIKHNMSRKHGFIASDEAYKSFTIKQLL